MADVCKFHQFCRRHPCDNFTSLQEEHLGRKSPNFLASRAVLVLFVTILFHKNGLWSYPVRSFFCSYISARQFVVCFFRSRYLVRRMYMALTIFPACGRDDRALCTSWRVESLVFWLFEGLKAFGVCLVLLGCFFRKNAEFSHFRLLHFHVI